MPIFEGVGYLDGFGVFGVNTLASLLFWGATEAPTIFSKEVPCVAHARFLWIIIRHPRGPIRVAAQSNGALKHSHADLVWSRVDCNKKFRIISVWGRRWSHNNFGKSGAIPHRMDKKWALKFQIALSVALRLWMSGGTRWYLIPKSSVIRCLNF